MKKNDLRNKVILVTGAAGFIGSNLVTDLLKTILPVSIIGIDNMNDYYDVSIKEYRLKKIEALEKEHPESNWTFIKGSIADKGLIDKIFYEYKPSIVVNLAAQAGVRYSITNPDAYVESNLIGFYNILEACRHSYDNGASGVEHLVYASSSSVYGSNKKVPYSTDDKVDNPVSLYAATKKSNELLAHAYSKLYNIPSTGLRFFTVYGPAGRPVVLCSTWYITWMRRRAVVLLPHGVLFRGAAEEVIRKHLIQKLNVLDAVIGLPANLFFGTGIPVCVLVLKRERNGNSDNILFIDASNDFEAGKNQNILRECDIDKIVRPMSAVKMWTSMLMLQPCRRLKRTVSTSIFPDMLTPLSRKKKLT